MKKLQDPNFEIAKLNEANLFILWKSYYPEGSGPLSTMRTVCKLIETIAVLKGYDVSNWVKK
jgi:hypothetical protein